MLQQENRLAKKRDFDLVLKYGYWVRSPLIGIRVLDLAKSRAVFPKKEDPDKFEKQLKLAFAVGLKISKKAVARNRLRRQLQEVVRLFIKNEGLREGFYVLVVPQAKMREKNYAEISGEVKVLFQRAKLFR